MRELRARLVDHLTLVKFQDAHTRASKSKGLRSEVLAFNINKIGNLISIMDIIGAGLYRASKYRRFWIYDPKKRLILALPYPDRVVHQWYIEEFIKPYFIPRFINDSFACIPGRGSHASVDRIQKYMRRAEREFGQHYYILKMDISKFFNNIDPDILFNILARCIADPALLELTQSIIYDGDEHYGMPIGNYVSQYFANIYLNELDWFCRRDLDIPYYVRYMDDFVALAPNRRVAREWYVRIDAFVNEHLNMMLNRKSRYYPGRYGLDFVGYKIYNDFRLVRKRSKKKIHDIIDDYENGIDSVERFVCRVNAWHGHVGHADAYHLTCARLSKYADKLPVVFPPVVADSGAGVRQP